MGERENGGVGEKAKAACDRNVSQFVSFPFHRFSQSANDSEPDLCYAALALNNLPIM